MNFEIINSKPEDGIFLQSCDPRIYLFFSPKRPKLSSSLDVVAHISTPDFLMFRPTYLTPVTLLLTMDCDSGEVEDVQSW